MAHRKQQAQKQPKTLQQLVKLTFNTPVGMECLETLKRVFVEREAFHTDTHKTAFMAGERSLVLLLQHYIHQEDVEDDGTEAGNESDAE